MKTIGLLGGMSWESTVHYYQIINEEVQNELGGLWSSLKSSNINPAANGRGAARYWEKPLRALRQPARISS